MTTTGISHLYHPFLVLSYDLMCRYALTTWRYSGSDSSFSIKDDDLYDRDQHDNDSDDDTCDDTSELSAPSFSPLSSENEWSSIEEDTDEDGEQPIEERVIAESIAETMHLDT